MISDDRQRFFRYSTNVNTFVQTVLGAAIIDDDDYIAGTERIDFHEKLLTGRTFPIFDYKQEGNGPDGTYEEALFQRLLAEPTSILVLVGGLGAGKSTAVNHLVRMIASRQPEVQVAFPCDCSPCLRAPITPNCIDIGRSYSSEDAVIEVLRLIRRDVYEHLMDEWLGRQGLAPNAVSHSERKVLRRLIIANDIYRWADAEALPFPANLHTAALALRDSKENLLSLSLQECRAKALFEQYAEASDLLDQEINTVVHTLNVAKKFTAVVVGFYVRKCDIRNANNTIIVDNIDQQPTEHIEQIVDHLHDLCAKLPGLRILLPLRPSSIAPQGFTYTPEYMYHYGPNCFDLVFRRLQKRVLSQSRDALKRTGKGNIFVRHPTPEEELCFLVAVYLYTSIALRGLHASADTETVVVPEVHQDLEFLHRVTFSGATLKRLSDTLGAIVGKCGRYAIAQLKRYFHHIYAHPFFLKQVLASTLMMGQSAKLQAPYALIVTALLGDYEGQAGMSALANLYAPTEHGPNPGRPSLAKLRTLAFLSRRFRVRIADVIRELAAYGIPREVAVGALNYLHDKSRLLLWFSRNSDLRGGKADDEQYVVISEHGQAYLRHLVGDFEYMWFCSQQIAARATGDDYTTFRIRLADYSRLVSEFASTEWMQITFRRWASDVVWEETEHLYEGEMLTLYVLYSSLERAVGGAFGARRTREADDFLGDVITTTRALCTLILQCQQKYEFYYGGNGYLSRYGALLSDCRSIVERAIDVEVLAPLRKALTEVFDSWSAQPHQQAPFAHDLLAEQPFDDQVAWEQFIAGIPFEVTPSPEWVAADAVGARRRRLLLRRQALRQLLETRVPTYGIVETNLELLIGELAKARDAAQSVSSASASFVDWVDSERTLLDEILHNLKQNSYKVTALSFSAEMDELKHRANNMSSLLVRLATHIGVSRKDHLIVRWSL